MYMKVVHQALSLSTAKYVRAIPIHKEATLIGSDQVNVIGSVEGEVGRICSCVLKFS